MKRTRATRGVSPVIGVILMVAITVILAAVVAAFALGLGGDANEPAPNIAQTTGSLEPNDNDGGIVRIGHQAGDSIDTSDMEILVDASGPCGKEGRVHSLPVPSGDKMDSSNIGGDDIFDESSLGYPPEIRPNALHEDEFGPGQEIVFRIAKSECNIQNGDEVRVQIVHEPTDSVVVDQTLQAN